jgi:hypothetical protein
MTDTLGVVVRQTRLGKTQKVDGIEQVGLAHAVQTNEAVDLRSKLKPYVLQVAVVDYLYLAE